MRQHNYDSQDILECFDIHTTSHRLKNRLNDDPRKIMKALTGNPVPIDVKKARPHKNETRVFHVPASNACIEISCDDWLETISLTRYQRTTYVYICPVRLLPPWPRVTYRSSASPQKLNSTNQDAMK
jgi:hypothetical protein